MAFGVSVPFIWVLWAQFPWLDSLSEYTKTGIYNSIIRYGLYTGVRLHLMPDLQFNTLDDFLYMHTHDQGYLGLICLISLNPPNINETDINQSSDGLYIWAMFHLICNVQFNTLNYLLCIDAHNLGCLGQTCLTCFNLTKTLKQV